jgi:hypothetical protein
VRRLPCAGQPAAHCGPVPVGHGCGAGRLCCRPSSVAAAAASACPAAVTAVHSAGAGGRLVSGRPCPVSARPDSRYPPAASGLLTSVDEQVQPARRCRSAETAAAGPPPSCRSQLGTAAGVWVAAAADTADAVAVRCCFRNGGRRQDGWMVSGGLVSGRSVSILDTVAACGRPRLQEAVARPAAGQVPPPPVGVGELAAEPVAEPVAHVGHRRPLQGQGLLGSQPAQPQA